MEIELRRYKKREGNRESDREDFVKWNVKVDTDRIIIKTESHVYVKNLKE